MYRLVAPHAMRQSKTISNTACDKDNKGTERRRSKYPPHLSSSNHPVKGRSTRQYPRTHQIWRQKTARCQMPKVSHFLPRDTSTDEYNCRALRPLDPFETTLRPHGDASMWLAIRSGRRGKTVQKVGRWARTFAPLLPAPTARVKLVFQTAALRVAETPALTPAMASAGACNSLTPPVKKKKKKAALKLCSHTSLVTIFELVVLQKRPNNITRGPFIAGKGKEHVAFILQRSIMPPA
ncbi:hypothetical protein ECC02_008045 [Trypanosoma cruzi]|uniref:Uncharacterized protein n=1 Tax=Trypanosoma cruzi TaxID=5693 RepID=A0A7J6XXB3_TRYCR|nr:hypothetical protein ECC02_008045 [Trypanosoma cruzi]